MNGADLLGGLRNDTLVVSADANFTLSNTSLTISINTGPIGITGIDTVMLSDGPGDHTLDASAFGGVAILSGGG